MRPIRGIRVIRGYFFPSGSLRLGFDRIAGSSPRIEAAAQSEDPLKSLV
jgi:hypothetical protein